MPNDESILNTMRFIPKHETVQRYDAIIPDTLTSQAMKESDAYKTYHDFATGKVIPKPKYVRRSTREKTDQAPAASPGKRLKATTKKSSDEDDDDEVRLSKNDDDNADNEDDDGQYDDNEQTESDNDGDDFFHPKFSTHNEEERQDEEDKDEEGSDLRVQTPSHFESTNNETYDEVTQGDNIKREKLDEDETNEEEDVNESYRDVNVNLERRDTEMTDALQANVQGIDFIINLNTESTSLIPRDQQVVSEPEVASFCQSLRNTNHVKDSELASLFGKLKYEANLIDNIYETEKRKSLISATSLSTAFLTTYIVQDFQDSPDDEEDTRNSHEYLNDLEKEYQARALLAKSK
ncbi:hypothetical protein Tco_1460879, partial [Tanacetum coccineum]